MRNLMDNLMPWLLLIAAALMGLTAIAAVLALALGPFAILGWFMLKIAHVMAGH